MRNLELCWLVYFNNQVNRKCQSRKKIQKIVHWEFLCIHCIVRLWYEEYKINILLHSIDQFARQDSLIFSNLIWVHNCIILFYAHTINLCSILVSVRDIFATSRDLRWKHRKRYGLEKFTFSQKRVEENATEKSQLSLKAFAFLESCHICLLTSFPSFRSLLPLKVFFVNYFLW